MAMASILAACLFGCQSQSASTVINERLDWPAPAQDQGSLCTDVGTLRVCWAAAAPAPAQAAVLPRPLPGRAAGSPLGWRCAGRGEQRTCRDRGLDASPFLCRGGECAQAHPRLPDDGDWSCAEMAGAALCLGGEPPAAVPAAAPAPGWICGRHAGRSADPAAPERVCVDLSPDFPDGSMTGWRCRYQHHPTPQRLCQRQAGAHQLTDPCDQRRPCIDGAHCVSGRCVPGHPAPSCWVDGDCGDGACRFGTCRPGDR
jgi:hypothetical protein